jgi:predicted ester cyclase
LRVSRAPFPDQRFEILGLFVEGDAVAMTWQWTGTHRGDIPGFPASGKRIRMSGATVYDFEGDRLRGHWQVKDALGVYQQLRQG